METNEQIITRFTPNPALPCSPPRNATHRGSSSAAAIGRRQARLIDVLASHFPVLRRLIGEPSFSAVVHRFMQSEPPSGLTTLGYGENFPGFLRSQGNPASIEYVADIAELEWIRGKARRARAARPLPAPALSSLPTLPPDSTRIVLHPSVFVLQSRFPIVTSWESNRNGGNGMIDRWGAEAALVSRPFREVDVRRLPPGGYAFVRSLSAGQTIAIAARAASAAAPKFEAVSSLAVLAESNTVVRILKCRMSQSESADRERMTAPHPNCGSVGHRPSRKRK